MLSIRENVGNAQKTAVSPKSDKDAISMYREYAAVIEEENRSMRARLDRAELELQSAGELVDSLDDENLDLRKKLKGVKLQIWNCCVFVFHGRWIVLIHFIAFATVARNHTARVDVLYL